MKFKSDQAKMDAILLCDEILDMLDDLPERAQEFSDSIREWVEGINYTILENRRVTENQATALENMKMAVEKWIR